MIKGSQNVAVHRSPSHQENPCPAQSRDDRGTDLGGREEGERRRGLPAGGGGEGCADLVLPLEAEVQGRRDPEPSGDEEGAEGKGSREEEARTRGLAPDGGPLRIIDRATAAEKKRGLGLTGDLRGRHLPAAIRA